jgi:hypothetical protein
VAARTAVFWKATHPDAERAEAVVRREHEGWRQTDRGDGYAGSRLDRNLDREGTT